MISNRVIALFLLLVLAMVMFGLWIADRPDPEPELLIENAETLRTIPVSLYAYDPRRDMDREGNVVCSEKGLVPVARAIPDTGTALRDTIALLLADPLTEEERAEGLTTEFPLEGVRLESVTHEGDTVEIEFRDPDAKLSGGSCRVSVLRAQLAATAKGFPGVDHVRFAPEGVLEP